jgi:hypothetical protein
MLECKSNNPYIKVYTNAQEFMSVTTRKLTLSSHLVMKMKDVVKLE